MKAPFTGELGTFEEVNDEDRMSETDESPDPFAGFVASVRLVDTDPDRDSTIDRRLTDT
jgi:hypothetical protein